MKAVIDEDLPRSFALILSQCHFTVFDIRDHGLRGCADEEIFAYAQKKKAVLFTADLDFSTIVFSKKSHYGVVILRFPNELSVSLVNDLVSDSLQKITTREYKSNLVILSPGGIRIRQSIIKSN